MDWLDRLFWSADDEDDESDIEPEEETVEFELTERFTRRTIRFEFVRGGETTITYDEFDGKRTDGRHYLEDGKTTTERGAVRVERFWQFSRRVQVRKQGSPRSDDVQLIAEPTGDEVTTMNVAARHVESEVEMKVAIPCERTVKVNPETGEQVHEGIPRTRHSDVTYEPFPTDSNNE